MKALVLAPEPFFTPRGTPFSVYHRTRMAAGLGDRIDLLTYGQGDDVEIEGVRIVRLPALRLLGPIPVGPSWRKLVLDALLFVRAVTLLLRHRYDYVHAHEEAVFLARWLKPLFGFRLVYDMHSRLSEQLGNFAFTRSRLLVGLFGHLERQALRHADVVIAISPALAEQAQRLMPDPARLVLIENTLFDDVRLTRASDAPRARDLVPPGRRIVLYAGNLEPYQGVDLLIGALPAVVARHPDAVLVVAGGAPAQVQTLRRRAEALGLAEHARFTGWLSPAEARCLQTSASVLTSPRAQGTNTPFKIYEQLASGIPLVATAVPAHTQVIDASIAFLAEPEPAALAAAICAVLDDPAAAQARAQAAQRAFAERHGPERYREGMQAVRARLGAAGAS